MTKPPFTLHLVWDSLDHSPEWELETQHAGFPNWLAPALLAEGWISPHPRLLELRDGCMTLRLDDGSAVEVGLGNAQAKASGDRLRKRGLGTVLGPSGITATLWKLSKKARVRRIVNSADYERTGGAAAASSLVALNGEWRPAAYEVRGEHGHVPVTVEFDEASSRVVVRLEDEELATLDGCDVAIGLSAKS